MSILGHLCMDPMWSMFDAQRRVIPLCKALTKLFWCYFIINCDLRDPCAMESQIVQVVKKRPGNI